MLLPPWMVLASAITDPHVVIIAPLLGLLLLLVPMLTLMLPPVLLPQWFVLAARGLASLTLSPWLLPPWSVLASAVADPHLAFIAPSSCQMRSVR